MAQIDQNPLPEEGASETTSGGYTIEIEVTADNKISVSVEPMSSEASEGGAEGEAEGDAQQVASFGEALRACKDIYAHAGEMQDTSGSAVDMESGYAQD